jgi:RimJ/RimL family protein N-acetyltransferase
VWLTTAFPELIELDSITLRPHSVDDAPSIVEAINHSREELRLWLPFANDDDAVTETAQRQRLEQVVDQWTNRTLFSYTVVNDGSFAGSIEVRPRPEPGRVSIGYWLDQLFWSHGLITKAAQALIDAAIAIPEIDGVEIRCDQANLRSVAVAKRLGFNLVEIRNHSIDAPGHSGRYMVWLKTSPKT